LEIEKIKDRQLNIFFIFYLNDMKKLTTILLFLVLICSFVFTGCKKKDNEPTKTEKLTGYNWYVTSAKVDPQVTISNQLTPIGSIYDQMEPCYKDDKIKFSADGSYTIDKGSNTCNTADQNYSAAWSFKDSETKLYLTNYGNTGEPITFNITELSTNIITLMTPVSNTAQLRLILQAYGLEYLLGTAKSVDPTFASGTKFTLVLRAL
jgi:hypothetical protein